MADCKFYTYEVLTTPINHEQQVMVQIFRDPETQQIITAQLSFKSSKSDTWGNPYTLEKKA
jgi:hypothetical protein